MNKKLQEELKFKIGEQYGKHEFELDWVKSILDNNLRFEVYQYIGKDKITIFDCEVQKILLVYNCDFLAGVFYFIESDSFSKKASCIQPKFSNTRMRRINVSKLDDQIWMIYVVVKKNKFDSLIDDIIKLGRI